MREDGTLPPATNDFGLASIPAFWPKPVKQEDGSIIQKPTRLLRIGYSGTSSHKEDFKTIQKGLNRLAKKYANQMWFVWLGDSWFADQQVDGRSRRHFIRETPYEIYRYNMRNLDIGIAPLEPTPFNMSKSDLKALEMASWGTCPVLPNYVTYNRSFTHGQNCMMYNNEQEFFDCMEHLINNPSLRKTLGNNARKYVYEQRLEKHHALRRYKLYDALIKGSVGLKQHKKIMVSHGN